MMSHAHTSGHATDTARLRIAIVQPCVPHYRVSFFRELAKRLGRQARLCVIYSDVDENSVRTADGLHGILGSHLDLVQVGRRTLPGKSMFYQRLPGKVLRDADIVVVNWNIRYLSTLYYVIWRAIKGRKIVGWGHYESRSGNRITQYLRQKLMVLFSAFWCYTEQEACRAVHEFPRLKAIVTGLNNGIEIDPVGLDRIKHQARLKSFEQTCGFLFIGRVVAKSEFHILLEALQLLGTDHKPAIRVEVIGGAADSIREQIAQVSCPGMVRYHGPVFDHGVIERIASSCHFFIFPGAVGLSLLHAFSLGLPAILHDQNSQHGPEAEAVAVNGRNSLLFSHGDARSLADTMRQAMSLPAEDYLKMVDACIETVRNDFNVGRMAERAAATLLA